MADKNPTAVSFRQMRIPDGLAAVEVTPSQASLVAGDTSAITVHKDTGVAMTGSRIDLVALPDAVKVAGILALNPYSFIPLAPTFTLSPPDIGLKYLAKATQEYIDMLKGTMEKTAIITSTGAAAG